MNVDEKEISKFRSHAHYWWDSQGVMKPLHDINPIRLQFIQTHLDLKHLKGIDIGCGGGILTESLANQGAHMTGIDMCQEVLDIAKLHALEQSIDIHYTKSSAEQISNEMPEQFDSVFCMELLEHVDDPAQVIQACAKLAKPGGKLFFSTINRDAKAYLFAILGAEYITRMLPRGTHQYNKFIKPSELANWCRECDLEVQEFKGISYNPLNKSYRLSDDLSVNYVMYAEKPL